jgi:parvulin-like peptidyl-prolyl isomerase
MMDRIRSRIRPDAGQPAIARQRRTSRRERELQQRRLLYIGTAVVGVAAVLILIGGAAYQYYFLPRQDLAKVNGEAVERRDYWKVRHLQLSQQVAQLSQQYQFVSADQQPEILQRIQDASEELADVEGAPISSDTLATMVDDEIVLQSIDDMGISISDDEIDQFVAEQFSPVPLAEPTQTPTSEPTAAAWATGTAEARNAAATQTAAITPTSPASPTTEASGTPEATVTEDAVATGTVETTGTASAESTGTPEANGTGTPAEGTPGAEGSPAASPTTSPTPNADEARATSESTFGQFDQNFLEPADMSRDDYERLIVRPTLARQKVADQLANEVPTRAEQVHAVHILVATREAAQEVINRINGGEDFATVASEASIDTGTAASGGDLGWFPRGIMVAPFDEAAFSLEVDQLSEPIQTQFGWHVIKVLEKEEDRPIALATRQQLQSGAFTKWLTERRNEADIESDIDMPQLESDQTQQDVFQAPPEAPVPPTPTVAPITTPIPETGTPEAETTETPAADGTGEPEATSTP